MLGVGVIVGIAGNWLIAPAVMSAFGVAFIGNIWALSMFGIGLLLRGYSTLLFSNAGSRRSSPAATSPRLTCRTA